MAAGLCAWQALTRCSVAALVHMALAVSARAAAGVPRVLTDRPLAPCLGPQALDSLPPELLADMASAVLQNGPPVQTGHNGASGEGGGAREGGKGCECSRADAKALLLPVLQHMQTCRVNISIRAVR